MRAIRNRRYGGPEHLTLEEVPLPEPAAGEVQLRVAAAGFNALDVHLMRGEPYLIRAARGIPRPRDPRLGADVAGVVTGIGPGVTGIALGDAVFGPTRGAFAEHTVARAADILPVPTGLAMRDAAVLPIAGTTALQALGGDGRDPRGRHVLVHGASGGVGHLTVQLARGLGAERVDAVTSARNAEFVAALGADRVVDYGRQEVTDAAERYDLVIDTVSTHPLARMQELLRPGGTLVVVGSLRMGHWFGPLAAISRAKRLDRDDARVVTLSSRWDRAALETLALEAAAGRLRPHISQSYALAAVADGVRAIEAGHVRGKLVMEAEERG
ncbi:MAG: NAD(P)-dependent alcohol dehydrogenase [Leifsonia xyli]|nr:MAG: NAD(P)-dependent alcohol dehydrogenase [Leifsonia xyli]